MSNAAYASLKSRFARIAALNEAAAMLHWDASAMMPAGGGAARGEQLATLAGLAHELLTAPAVTEDLSMAKAEGDWEVANLALMRRKASEEPRDDTPEAMDKVWEEEAVRFGVEAPQDDCSPPRRLPVGARPTASQVSP